MSDEKLTKIDASPEAKGLERDLNAEAPKNVKEFEVLLSRYEKQNPVGYELKLKNGTFVKQAKALGFVWGKEIVKPVAEPIVKESEVADSKVKDAPKEEVKPRGRPSKTV